MNNEEVEYIQLTVRIPGKVLNSLKSRLCNKYGLNLNDCIKIALVEYLEFLESEGG